MKMPEPQERTRTQVSIGLSFAFDCSEVGASFLIMQKHFFEGHSTPGFFFLDDHFGAVKRLVVLLLKWNIKR